MKSTLLLLLATAHGLPVFAAPDVTQQPPGSKPAPVLTPASPGPGVVTPGVQRELLVNPKFFRQGPGTFKLPAAAPVKSPKVEQRRFTHLYLELMVGNDDLRNGGRADFFMEFEDGGRASVQIAVPGSPLAGSTMYSWRWALPEAVDPLRIKHIGFTTALDRGDGGLSRPDTWRIGRVKVTATRESGPSLLDELQVFDEPVGYALTAWAGPDEWKSGEVESYRGPQFTRTDELLFEVISGNFLPFPATTSWQARVDLMDGRRFESTLAQASHRTLSRDEFGRTHMMLGIKVPGIARGDIRRVSVHSQPLTTGRVLNDYPKTELAQVNIWASSNGVPTRQWMAHYPNRVMDWTDTLWSSPVLAPLVLPQDVAQEYGVELWSGADDLREDSMIEMVLLVRPSDMHGNPRRITFAVNSPRSRAGGDLTQLWKGSAVPAHSRVSFGVIAPRPLPAPGAMPKLSDIMGLGIVIRPGPGVGSWNPDTFHVRHMRFYYSDGKDLRELWAGHHLNLVLDAGNPGWSTGDLAPQFGVPLPPRAPLTTELIKVKPLPVKP